MIILLYWTSARESQQLKQVALLIKSLFLEKQGRSKKALQAVLSLCQGHKKS